MRTARRMNEDGGQLGEAPDIEAVLTRDIEDLVDALGDDWSLLDAEELDLDALRLH